MAENIRNMTIRSVEDLREAFNERGDLGAWMLLYTWIFTPLAETKYKKLASMVEEDLRADIEVLKQVYEIAKEDGLERWIREDEAFQGEK